MAKPLPPRPSLSHLAKQAKSLRKAFRDGSSDALQRIRASHPRSQPLLEGDARSTPFLLSDAQLVIAREYGFDSWTKLKRQVEAATLDFDQRATAIVEASLAGDLARARALYEADAALPRANLCTACVLGEDEFVSDLLDRTPELATQNGGPRDWEPLLYVCFSRFLGQPGIRSEAMVRLARMLLDAGASPNAFFRINDDPNAKQTALYGAAGINNHPEMTALLLEAGADPNDDAPGLGPESLYHAAESSDHDCLRLILRAGPDRDKVSYCLGRKLDFDDPEGVRLFLQHGADPNFEVPGRNAGTRLHGAVRRGHGAPTIEMLLEYGASLTARTPSGLTPYALAVRCGNEAAADVLRRHGAEEDEVNDIDRFLGACRRADRAAVDSLLRQQPDLMNRLRHEDRQSLAQAAQRAKRDAVQVMLEIGFDPAIAGEERMTALHSAAWQGDAGMVELILRFDPPLEVKNMYGGTPLDCAVYGSVHCHAVRGGARAGGTPQEVRHGDYVSVVKQLIAAGADVRAVSPYPSGNEAVDAVLQPYRQPHRFNQDQIDEAEPGVHDHVRASEEFFSRFALPESAVPLRTWLDRQVEGLLAAHQRHDLAAAMTIRLAAPPADRPTDEQIFKAKLNQEGARLCIALSYCFDSWAKVEAAKDRLVEPRFERAVDAVVQGRVDMLQQLLADDATLIQARSAFGHRATLLHYVAANGVEIRRQRTPRNVAEITRLLLAAGAEVDALAESYGGGLNQTPLCLAVSSGHPFAAGVQGELVDALLDGGAKINGLRDDCMPLATALAFGYLSTAELLARRGCRVDNVVLAAGLGRLDLLRTMIDDQGRISSAPYVDPFGKTIGDPHELKDHAFFLTCKLGHVDVARFLLDRGANLNAPPAWSQTALHWAAYGGHLAVVKLLVEHGADTTLRDAQWNSTPLDWALEGQQEDVARYLMESGS